MVCTHIAHLSPFVCLSLFLSRFLWSSLPLLLILSLLFVYLRQNWHVHRVTKAKMGKYSLKIFLVYQLQSQFVFFPPIQSSFSFGLSYVCNQQMPPNMDVIVIWLIEFIAVLAQNISSFSKEPPRQCTHEHPQLKMINITVKQQQRQQIFHGIYHLFIQIISILLTRMVYRSIVWWNQKHTNGKQERERERKIVSQNDFCCFVCVHPFRFTLLCHFENIFRCEFSFHFNSLTWNCFI